jgi:CPA2 family monovalent cation:H+ antiporter-2
MGDIQILQDLVIVMIVAGCAALVCHWLDQPKVLGYIIAGVILGPHTFPYHVVNPGQSVLVIADVGVAFLMFSLGMDFNLRKLKSVGLNPVIIAVTDVTFMLWMGFTLGRMLKWNTVESIFLGGILCESSTIVITRMLGETNRLASKSAGLAIAATIIEDLLAIVLIAILTGVGITGTVQAEHVMMRMGELLLFLVALLVTGVLIIKRIVNYVARLGSNELLSMTVLGICFGVCIGTVKLHFSMALGAFIIGAVMAEATASFRIAILTQSLRDLFGPVFFVAIGLWLDPAQIVLHAGVILLLTSAVVAGKLFGISLGAWLGGSDRRTAFGVGCGMAQICEFALIIAALAVSLHAVREYVYPVVVSVTILTILINPYLIRFSDALFNRLDALTPPALAAAMTFYTRWATTTRRQKTIDIVRKTIIRCLTLIGVNLCLISTIFITTAFLGRLEVHIPLSLPPSLGGVRAVLWLIGALLSIPLYVATLRKLNALSMIIAEIRFPVPTGGGVGAAIARNLTSKLLLLFGVSALALFTFMLTAALLPPLPVLIVSVAILATVMIFFWKFNIRIYASAQTALREALSTRSPPLQIDPATAIPYAFRDATLASVPIQTGALVAGSSIGDLAIRTRTGASVIGIERKGETIMNPGADEMIYSGDSVILLGLQRQIEEARLLLSATRESQNLSDDK